MTGHGVEDGIDPLDALDVEHVVTHLLELCLRRGGLGAPASRAADLDDLVRRLSRSPHLTGFDSAAGRRVLAGWLRTAVVRVQPGTSRVRHVRPTTVAGYRTGLPRRHGPRPRRVARLVHAAMTAALERTGAADPAADLAALVLDAIGTGVDVGPGPWNAPRYDGVTPLDVTTLLTLRLVETCEPTPGGTAPAPPGPAPEALPRRVLDLGTDLVQTLRQVPAGTPPERALARVTALVSLRLLQTPLHGEVYVDLTRRPDGASAATAAWCVRRDLEHLRRARARRLADAVHEVARRDGTDVTAQAHELAAGEGAAAERARRLLAAGLGPAETLAVALDGDGAARAEAAHVRWMRSTGAPGTAHGLLTGAPGDPSTWRYGLGDTLLQTVLPLCFVREDGTPDVSRLPVTVVLERLSSRFDLLVDRVPAPLRAAGHGAGAETNLEAFTQALQLLGCFHGLSDDLEARFVTHPAEAR